MKRRSLATGEPPHKERDISQKELSPEYFTAKGIGDTEFECSECMF